MRFVPGSIRSAKNIALRAKSEASCGGIHRDVRSRLRRDRRDCDRRNDWRHSYACRRRADLRSDRARNDLHRRRYLRRPPKSRGKPWIFGRATLSTSRSHPLYRQSVRRSVGSQWRVAPSFSAKQDLGTTVPAGPAIQSFVLELILTAILMFVILGVSDWCSRERHYSGYCRWCCDWARGDVRRSHLRSVDEPGAIARTGRHLAPLRIPVDLPACSRDRCLCCCTGLPLCAGIRMLLRQNSAPSQRSVVSHSRPTMRVGRQLEC